MLPDFSLLSSLWLREPAGDDLRRAQSIAGLAPHAGDPAALAVAYTDLFLLNVFPYASVFLEPTGELNGARARELLALYNAHNYSPPALRDAAAPDHLGLALGLLGHVGQETYLPLAPYLLDWAPVLCLAVEREPGAHPFYAALARLTRDALFAAFPAAPLPRVALPMAEADGEPDDETSLHAIIGRLLAPARCGLYLSRARLGHWARDLGMPVPFGERFRVAVQLFEAAGATGQVTVLLERLTAEAHEWDAAYTDWAERMPGWAPYSVEWRGRIAAALEMLRTMRLVAVEGGAPSEGFEA